jgi:diphthamide biosynthesis protein 2
MKEKFNDKVHVSQLVLFKDENNKNDKEIFGRLVPHNVQQNPDSYCFFYIGSNDLFLNPFLLYFNKHKFYQYHKEKSNLELIPYSNRNRSLMKRYYLIERARDAKIFGILIGTMSVAQYANAVDHVSKLLKQNGRRYYSFLIGKLNCPKLNNFMEVDVYVLIACSENSLIDSKELNKPVITVYELEIALNAARLWGNEFICDFKQLLPGHEHYIESELNDNETDVSLITGSIRLSKTKQNESSNQQSLINRDDGLAMMHFSGAGIICLINIKNYKKNLSYYIIYISKANSLKIAHGQVLNKN